MNDLWDDLPDPPAQRHSDTSRAAAEDIKPKAETLRARVYWFIQSRGTVGATDDEVQRHLPMDPSTQRPRRVELVNAGLVVDSGRRRPTASGKQAAVWVAAEFKGGAGKESET